MKREIISGPQLVFLLIPVVTATEFMSVPGVIYQYAKEDAWISYLLSLVPAIWAILVFTTLALRNPGMSFTQYTEKILGKWLGKIVGLLYIYYLFVYVTTITDENMTFITLFALPHTPRVVTISSFLLVCGVGAWLGIEALARCSEFLVPLSIVFALIVSVLLMTQMVPQYLLPSLGHGIRPIFQGAIVPSAWAGEFFILGFLLPYLNVPHKSRKYSLLGLLFVMLIMLMVIFESIMVGGPLTSQLKYAYYAAVRYVSIGNFLERIDPVVLSVWVYIGFIKAAVFLWAFATCIAQVFGMSNYRMLVIPVSLLSIAGCFWIFSNAFEMSHYLATTFPASGLVSQNLIPTLILLVDVVRTRKRGQYEPMSA